MSSSLSPAVTVLPSGVGTSSRPRALRVCCQPAVLSAGLGFVLYLVPATQVLQLGPDQVEYIDVARHLVAGEGYVLSVKAFHFGGPDVLHDGLAQRPPLLPFLIAGLLRLGLGLYAVQVMNAALTAVCAGLVCALGTRLFDCRTGALAGLLAATSPVVLQMISPMTEAPANALTLMALWLVVRFADPPRWAAFAGAGLALGLGYLARPTVAALAAAIVAGSILVARDRRAVLAPVVGLLVGIALVAAPISLHSLATRGSLSYTGQDYLYRVYDDVDVMQGGYRAPLPSVAEFVATNYAYLVQLVLNNAESYAKLLLLDPAWMLPLLPAWPLALLALARGRYPRSARIVLLVAATNYLIHVLTWANFAARYQILTMYLLLPFAVDGLARLGLGRWSLPSLRRVTALHAVVVAAALSWSPVWAGAYAGQFVDTRQVVGTRIDDGLRWTGPPNWITDDLPILMDWVATRTDRNDVLAAADPWPFTFFTGRPSVLLPQRLTAEHLRSLLAEYRVSYLLLDPRDRPRRFYRDYLDALADRGVRSTTVGTYRFYDTRALWR